MDRDEELARLLNAYFNQKVQLHQVEKTRALNVWKEPVDEILQSVKSKDGRFDLHPVYSGSYYEKAKVKKPNEFDIMLEIKGLELGRWEPYDTYEDSLSNDPPLGYTTVMIDLGEEEDWRPGNCIGNGNLLNSTNVKATFKGYVSEAIRQLGYSHSINTASAGPAVTLNINHGGQRYDVDLVLAIKDATWPDDAESWKSRPRNGWPSPTLVKEIVSGGCHLVAKKPKTYSQRDVDYMWRYSFSSAEKKLSLEGSSGGAETCRKIVLRILKSLKEDFQLTPLTSYHLKTIVFFEWEEYPNHWQWQTSTQLAVRFRSALGRLLRCLKERNCPHYFIKGFNLFDHSSFNAERYLFLIQRIQSILSNPSQYLRV